ncbi:hypothetical protein [Prevotella sp. 10(H)]|uniref:hypothetical protein n=1 Tax=Prevotella sp. 10(H) TaxID=1158294 RepID=UPI0004A6FA23|nr:hypothetical protein [Prevotella sp. 10(H)]
MRIKGALKAGDILYRVDPRKLSVKVFRIGYSDERKQAETTHENFFLDKNERKQLQMPIEKFPFEFKGLLYFLTEDEANNFIKTQIGM